MLNVRTISARISLGFSLPVILALAVDIFGAAQFAEVGNHSRTAAALAGSMQRVLEASHLLETIRRGETHYRLDADDASLNERDRAESRIRTLLATSDPATSEDRPRVFDELLASLRAHDSSFAHLVQLTHIIAAANTKLDSGGRELATATAKLMKAARANVSPAVLEAANNLQRLLLILRGTNWRFQALYDPKGPAAFDRDQSRAQAAIAALTGTGDVEVSQATDDVAAAFETFANSFHTMADATLASIEVDGKELVPQIVAMQHHLATVQEFLVTAFDTSGDKNRRSIEQASLLQQLITVLLLVSGAAMVYFIGRSISRPITAMTGAMRRLASGNMAIAIPTLTRSDEIGDMARAVSVFKESMIKADRLTTELKQQISRREEAEAVAADLARHDPLTGLPNRRLFAEEITRRLLLVSEGQRLAIMLIDLDGFKAVNDVHGHHAGDAVLQDVVVRLNAALPSGSFVARLGGDEFAILTPPGYDETNLERQAYTIVHDISVPFVVQTAKMEIGASIGIAFAPTDGTDPSNLLRAADIAMYRAKGQGGGTMCFFEASMDVETRALARMREELRAAITDHQIVPYYQPLVDLRSGGIVGFEVLARWHHPSQGVLGPDKFIPLVEQMKLSTAMTLALVSQACADAQAWPDGIRLSVNIAPVQLQERELIRQITAVVVDAGLSPSRIELELIETALTGDIAEARRFIEAAHEVGMTVALDDFGTGHSSLSRLYELPLDKVKIDRSFMRDISNDRRSAAYVAAIVNLGKTLELCTTAEGIEDTDVMAELQVMGCDYGQGYLYAKPVPAMQAGILLTAQPTQCDPVPAADLSAPGLPPELSPSVGDVLGHRPENYRLPALEPVSVD